jgi:serine/threonine-protein kinase
MSRIVKNYEIHHVLGEGGMGTVFHAIEVQLSREVALKCLRHDVTSKPGVAERFRNEAQAQAQLNHPQIAHLYEYFQFGAEHYMAMEYVNGSTFAKVLRERGRLPLQRGRRLRRAGIAGTGTRPPARHRAPRHQARQPDDQ